MIHAGEDWGGRNESGYNRGTFVLKDREGVIKREESNEPGPTEDGREEKETWKTTQQGAKGTRMDRERRGGTPSDNDPKDMEVEEPKGGGWNKGSIATELRKIRLTNGRKTWNSKERNGRRHEQDEGRRGKTRKLQTGRQRRRERVCLPLVKEPWKGTQTIHPKLSGWSEWRYGRNASDQRGTRAGEIPAWKFEAGAEERYQAEAVQWVLGKRFLKGRALKGRLAIQRVHDKVKEYYRAEGESQEIREWRWPPAKYGESCENRYWSGGPDNPGECHHRQVCRKDDFKRECEHRFRTSLPESSWKHLLKLNTLYGDSQVETINREISGGQQRPILWNVETKGLWGQPVASLREWDKEARKWKKVEREQPWVPLHKEWGEGPTRVITCKPGASLEEKMKWNLVCLNWEDTCKGSAYCEKRKRENGMRTVVVPRLRDTSTETGMTTRRFSEDAAFLWAMVEDDKRWVSSWAWQPTKESGVQWNKADLAYPTLVQKTSHKSIHERYEAAIERLRELEGSTTSGRECGEEKGRVGLSDTSSQEGSRSPSNPPNSVATTEERHSTPTPITHGSAHSEDELTGGGGAGSEGKETQECWFCYISCGSSYGGEVEEEDFRVHIWEHLMEDMSFENICPAQCGTECADRRSLAHHFFEEHQGLRTIKCRRCGMTFLAEREKEGHKCGCDNFGEKTGTFGSVDSKDESLKDMKN